MWSSQRVSRLVAWALALSSVVAVAGCSTSGEKTASTTTSRSAGDYDLARLSELEDDMPPGFIPYPTEPRKLERALVAGLGTVVSYGKPFTVEPAECGVLLKPVDGQEGAGTAGFRADAQDNAQAKRSISVGADMPITVPAKIPATGCDQMTYTVADDNHPSSGSAERIAAPDIDGATTFALRITVDGFPDPEYFYAAIIDDRVFVDVQARLAPDFQAQPLLPDLLVKAVAAIRR